MPSFYFNSTVNVEPVSRPIWASVSLYEMGMPAVLRGLLPREQLFPQETLQQGVVSVLVMDSGGAAVFCEPVPGASSGAHSEKAASLCSNCSSLVSKQLHGQVLVPSKDETPLVTSYLESHIEIYWDLANQMALAGREGSRHGTQVFSQRQ